MAPLKIGLRNTVLAHCICLTLTCQVDKNVFAQTALRRSLRFACKCTDWVNEATLPVNRHLRALIIIYL